MPQVPALSFSPNHFAPAPSVSALAATSSSRGEGEEVLLQLLQRKKYEIAELERKHSASMDPLQLRLGYVSDTSSLRLTRALRLFKLGDDRRVAVVSESNYSLGRAINRKQDYRSDFFKLTSACANYLYSCTIRYLIAVRAPLCGW